MTKYKVVLSLTEPLLGTVPKSRKVYEGYVASKAAENGLSLDDVADELETVQESEEQAWTGFHLLNDKPVIYDYAVKGFFKDACSMLRRVPGTVSSKLTSHKKVIDGLVFVTPRRIPIILSGEIGALERPLRAQTAQGERVAISRSDTAPVGSRLEFVVELMQPTLEAAMTEWLNYGSQRGLGQWRNGGYGTFTYTMEKVA